MWTFSKQGERVPWTDLKQGRWKGWKSMMFKFYV